MRNPTAAPGRSPEVVLTDARSRLAREPASSPACILELLALAALHHEKETLAAAERLAALAPGDAGAAVARALAHREVGRADEALRAAGEAVRLAPDDAATHAALGLALAGMGKPVEARAAAARAVELSPMEARFHRQLADRWRDVDPARAERHYRDALRLDWRSAAAQLGLSLVLERQGRRVEAQAATDAALALDPAILEPRKRFRRDLLAVLQGGLAVFLVVVMINWTQAIIRVRWPAARVPSAIAAWVAVIAVIVALFVFSLVRARRLRREAPPSPELWEALNEVV